MSSEVLGSSEIYSNLYVGLYEIPSLRTPYATTANQEQKTAAGISKLKQMETPTLPAFPSKAESLPLSTLTAPVTLSLQPSPVPNYKTCSLIIVINFSFSLWLCSSFTSDDEQLNPNSFIQHVFDECLPCVRLCNRDCEDAMNTHLL